MSTAIICVILAAIVVYAVISYKKKVTRGCCGAETDAPQKVTPADGDASHYPYQYSLVIEGMSCKACARRVMNAFNKEGFYALSANFKTGEAAVLSMHEAEEADFRLVAANAGYSLKSCKLLSDGPPHTPKL